MALALPALRACRAACGCPNRQSCRFVEPWSSLPTPLRQIRKSPLAGARAYLAERGGFEPPRRYKRLPDFESGTFNRSATSPAVPPGRRGAHCTGCSRQPTCQPTRYRVPHPGQPAQRHDASTHLRRWRSGHSPSGRRSSRPARGGQRSARRARAPPGRARSDLFPIVAHGAHRSGTAGLSWPQRRPLVQPPQLRDGPLVRASGQCAASRLSSTKS